MCKVYAYVYLCSKSTTVFFNQSLNIYQSPFIFSLSLSCPFPPFLSPLGKSLTNWGFGGPDVHLKWLISEESNGVGWVEGGGLRSVGWRKENRHAQRVRGMSRVGEGEGYLWVPSADGSVFPLWVGWEVGRGVCESRLFSVIFSFLTWGWKQPITHWPIPSLPSRSWRVGIERKRWGNRCSLRWTHWRGRGGKGLLSL